VFESETTCFIKNSEDLKQGTNTVLVITL
jgi:hypothetical protein